MNSTQAWPPVRIKDKMSPVNETITDIFVWMIPHTDFPTSMMVFVLDLAHPMIPCLATKINSLK